MSGLSKTRNPQVVEYEKTKVLPDIDQVKPASQLSDFRSVAALAALRACQGTNFQNLGGCWVTRLMNATWVFQERLTGRLFISFGVYGDASLLWEISAFGEEDRFFRLSLPETEPCDSARQHLQFICTSDLWHPGSEQIEEEFEGVPTKVCFLENWVSTWRFLKVSYRI